MAHGERAADSDEISPPQEITPREFELQACLADADDESEYRFLVYGRDIKYVTVEAGALPPDDMTFEPALKTLLPTFPPGDWNEGRIVRDKVTGKPIFASTTRRDLPGVRNMWHPQRIDHLQLTWVERVRQNVRLVTCPLFKDPVLFKFAVFPWQIPRMEKETTAYSWIHGHGIGPRFLGHVTEAGRVIGFLMEKVAGRTAEIEDLDACQRAVRKMHALQLKHGDVNKYNFLVSEGKQEAVSVDFECTIRCQDEKELMKELEELPEKLRATDGIGGVVTVTEGDEDEE